MCSWVYIYVLRWNWIDRINSAKRYNERMDRGEHSRISVVQCVLRSDKWQSRCLSAVHVWGPQKQLKLSLSFLYSWGWDYIICKWEQVSSEDSKSSAYINDLDKLLMDICYKSSIEFKSDSCCIFQCLHYTFSKIHGYT